LRPPTASAKTADVLGRGAAAAADDADAQLLDETGLVLDELLGGEVVVHLAVDDRGQPGVGHDDDGHPAGLGQVAHVLGHFDRAGGAVDADDVRAHRIEGHQRGRDLGAGQHAPGELDGHLHLDRDLAPHLGHCIAAGGHRRLGPQQIELGLDDVQVDAAFEQAEGGLVVAGPQVLIGDVAQGGELGAGAHRSAHPPGTLVGGKLVGCSPGQLRRLQRQLVGPVGDVVLAQRHAEGTEAVGLDRVSAGLQVLPVHLGDQLGTGVAEDLVAALERIAAEVVGSQIVPLQPGPRGAVEHDDPLADGRKVRAVSHKKRKVTAPGQILRRALMIPRQAPTNR
jgi:hypothetical protein